METLRAGQWPKATESISEICLEVKSKRKMPIFSNKTTPIFSNKVLYLDIVDYPGEWLLDLPLLQCDYAQLSNQVANRLKNTEAPPWVALGQRFKQSANFADENIAEVAASYVQWLFDLQKHGLSLIQPGRFIKPGALHGSPLLEFVPWVWGAVEDHKSDEALINVLARRYEEYKSKVVKEFYERHFKRLDRQVVLVDCLAALKQGVISLSDLSDTLEILSKNFAYGKLGILKRMIGFAPKISRLAFAATKADHILPAQYANLKTLLRHIVTEAERAAKIDTVETGYFALASVKATRVVEEPGSQRKGLVVGNKAINPGDIPEHLTRTIIEKFSERFELLTLPPPELSLNDSLPHINMDEVIHFLLKDKM
jgi:predicted YcjX-like family ATPase